MPNSRYCADCVINWYPYQARKDRCPVCGSGVQFRQEPASDEAIQRFQAAAREGGDTIAFDPVLDTEALSAEIAALPVFTGERRFAT